jgi:hypothetical protein
MSRKGTNAFADPNSRARQPTTEWEGGMYLDDNGKLTKDFRSELKMLGEKEYDRI